MDRVLIVGAAETGLELESFLEEKNVESKKYEFIGFYDELQKGANVINDIDNIERPEKTYFLNSIGNTSHRRRITEQLIDKGLQLMTLQHRLAYVDHRAHLSEGVLVYPNVSISYNARIGRDVLVGFNSSVAHGVQMGDNIVLAPGVDVAGNVEIGDNCFLGVGAAIKNKIKICDDVFLGAGALVVKDITEPGVYIGHPVRRYEPK